MVQVGRSVHCEQIGEYSTLATGVLSLSFLYWEMTRCSQLPGPFAVTEIALHRCTLALRGFTVVRFLGPRREVLYKADLSFLVRNLMDRKIGRLGMVFHIEREQFPQSYITPAIWMALFAVVAGVNSSIASVPVAPEEIDW